MRLAFRLAGALSVSLAIVALLAAGAALAQPTVQQTARRPPPLPPQPSCELWRGMGTGGNDPSVQLELLVCPAGGTRVTGRAQWSSLLSGYNIRDTDGEWRDGGTKLRLRDLRVREEHPQPGWRFCTIDAYELRRVSPTRLEGHYDSAACQDHANLTLDRVEGGQAPAPMPPPPTPRPPSGPPSPPAGGGGLCTVSPPGASTPVLGMLGIAAGVAWLVRRRCRGRRARGR